MGYRVYSGTASGIYEQAKGAGFDAGATPAYTIDGLQPGRVHYFAVTAYDASGTESDYSAEASKLVQ